MTHGISNDDYQDQTSYSAPTETRTQTPEEKLIDKIRQHIEEVRIDYNKENTESRRQKITVLSDLIKYVSGNGVTLQQLQNTIDNNPQYNKAFFKSQTEQLVKEAIALKSPEQKNTFTYKR